MEQSKPLAIHVYRRMLKQAEIYRQKMKKEIENKELADHYADLSSELYYWVAELEKTPEINPAPTETAWQRLEKKTRKTTSP